MSDELFIKGTRYLSVREAAQVSALHQDHIARLARSGKIRGMRIGKNWYIEEKSIHSFLILQTYHHARRKHALAAARRHEYREFLNREDARLATPSQGRSLNLFA